MSDHALREMLAAGPVVVAEGFVFELERSCLLQAGAFVPSVVLENPRAVRELTDRFLDAGSDVALALTYYTNAEKLKRVGLEGRLEDINRAALDIANAAAADAATRHGRRYLVAGNVCNTYEFEYFKNRDRYGREVMPGIRKQARWAREAGVDYVVGETYVCFEEARLHLEAIKDEGVPAVITLSARGERTLDGYAYDEACHELWSRGAEVVGLNCTRGPRTMLPILERIRQHVPPEGHVAALPVPHRTTEQEPIFMRLGHGQAFPTGLDAYLCTRNEMGAFARTAYDLGVRYLGICCGAGPHHVRAMAEALGRRTPASQFSPDMSKHGALGRTQGDAVRQAWSGDTILGPLDELPPQGIAQAYDRLATDYRDLVRRAGYVLPERMATRLRDLFEKLQLPLDQPVIDAGCGNGLAGAALKDAGFTQVYGLDLSPGLIAQIPDGLYQSFDGEGVIEASLTNLPERYWQRFDHVFCAGTISHTPTLDLEGLVKLARPGGIVAFSVRESRLARYDEALVTLRGKGIWTNLAEISVPDERKDTSPHVVLFEHVTGDPVARFGEIAQLFYRVPSMH